MLIARLACVLFAVSLCLCAVPSRPVAAQESLPPLSTPTEDPKTAELRKEITGYYARMDRAWEQFDVNGSVQYMPLDYTFIDKTGKKDNLSRYKDSWRMVARRMTSGKMDTEINVFTVKGDTITAETRKNVVLTLRRDDGVNLYGEAFQQARDFWIKRKGKWIIKQSRVYDFTVKINGQLIYE